MFNVKDLEDAAQAMQDLGTKFPKALKVTTAFAEYLIATTPPLPERPDGFIDGTVGRFDSTPIIIDDEINGLYEFVY